MAAAGLDKAIRHIRETRGMAVEIAKACGVHRSAVYQWTQVPSHQVLKVAPILEMSPEEIRPDIFGQPKKRRAR